MSSNKFFHSLSKGYSARSEYGSKCRKWKPEKIGNDDFHEALLDADIEGFIESIIEENRTPVQNETVERTSAERVSSSAEKKSIGMQEMENCMLQSSITRKVYGRLCIWNNECYVQLSPTSFAKAVRGVLPQDMQNKISRFSIFNDAYRYMHANNELDDRFSEQCVEETKLMICCKNGVFNAGTGKLSPHDPNYPVYFCIDAEYDSSDKDTSVMDDLIDKATGNDKAVKRLFYEVLGYIISQNASVKKFFVFGTAPDSGKSVIGEFIGKLLGEDNISTIELHNMSKPFASGTISLKVLNYNMDLPAKPIDEQAVQKLKQWTGDPRVNSEIKFVQDETVYHHCKLLFATNHPIKLKSDDDAFFNRLVLIPFVRSVSEEDKDYELGKKLWQSRNAIVTKAAKAYKGLCDNNFVFTQSIMAQNMIESWRNRPADYLLSRFIDDRCIIDIGNTAIFTPTEELFRAFQEYWTSQGQEVRDEDKYMFSRRLHEGTRLEPHKKRVKGYPSPVNGYYGIALKDE